MTLQRNPLKPTLILLPGMLCDSAYYHDQLDALRTVAQVSIAAYPAIPTIAEMAQQVLQDAPQRFAVAGHSMGGRVVQQIVACAPERVTGVGLFGTDYRGFRDEAERAGEEARRREWLAAVDRDGFSRFAQQWAPRLVAPRRQSDRELIARITQMAERFGRVGLDAHCRAGLSRVDYTALLPRIAVPTLLIAGSEDGLRTPALHREMASRIADAQVAVIEGAGHLMSMEEPAAVTAAMLPWLARLAT